MNKAFINIHDFEWPVIDFEYYPDLSLQYKEFIEQIGSWSSMLINNKGNSLNFLLPYFAESGMMVTYYV